jgi:endonuclease/exonuclease/phosphatase (EEP) superfamily protein YafD
MSSRRHVNRALVVAAWLIVGALGVLTLAQAIGVTGSPVVAVAQTFTPYTVLLLVPIIVVTLARRRQLVLATVATAIVFGVATLAVPLTVPDPQAEPAADAVGLRVAAANLWYRNTEVATVADELEQLDADVLVLSEYTVAHQVTLEASGLADMYPHKSQIRGRGPTRISVWSRLPLSDQRGLDTYKGRVELTVRGPDGDVDLVAMHLPTPIADFEAWQQELATASDVARTATAPVLLIGDLNATYWHPEFRRLLDSGFVDAHIAAGRGMSTSWPTDWFVPPFVRLDHALTGGGLDDRTAKVVVVGQGYVGLPVAMRAVEVGFPRGRVRGVARAGQGAAGR